MALRPIFSDPKYVNLTKSPSNYDSIWQKGKSVIIETDTAITVDKTGYLAGWIADVRKAGANFVIKIEYDASLVYSDLKECHVMRLCVTDCVAEAMIKWYKPRGDITGVVSSLTDNGDGTYTFFGDDGVVLIELPSLSTLPNGMKQISFPGGGAVQIPAVPINHLGDEYPLTASGQPIIPEGMTSFIVNAGPTDDPLDDAYGSTVISSGDILHFYGADTAVEGVVLPGSARIGINVVSSGDPNNLLKKDPQGIIVDSEDVIAAVNSGTLTATLDCGNLPAT